MFTIVLLVLVAAINIAAMFFNRDHERTMMAICADMRAQTEDFKAENQRFIELAREILGTEPKE